MTNNSGNAKQIVKEVVQKLKASVIKNGGDWKLFTTEEKIEMGVLYVKKWCPKYPAKEIPFLKKLLAKYV